MANISYDDHGIIIDGRRIWLVSGVIDYARVSRGLWADRVRAAKQAGLNCITTSVLWSLHEPQPGVFRFDEEADLRHFVELVAEHQMYCILRPGPFVGSGWDLGGLPPWLLESREARQAGREPERIRLREASPPFLQAVARYLDAVMGQVGELQMTEPRGGPIVLVQCEHEWFCHNPRQGEAYLSQVSRFLRESGCAVPLVNTNNLYQQVPHTIDGWVGDDHLFANCRQLRTLQGDAPSLVMSLPTGAADRWGAERPEGRSAGEVMRRMADASAAGAMFNLDPFCGGTNFGFRAGRQLDGEAAFLTTSHDAGAPLGETGRRGDKFHKVRRLATFLSQFGTLMAGLQPREHHTVAGTGLAVVQQTGTQGRVVFLLRDEQQDPRHTELVTPDGQALPVDLGDDPVAWVVLNTNLTGKVMLDLTNLRPWALIERRLLVLYGPAGSQGIVSLDGALRFIDVPTGGEPLIFRQDDLHVAVLNERQVDAAYIHEGGLYVGVGGIGRDGKPLPHDAFASYTSVKPTGRATKHRRKAVETAAAPRLGKWHYADLDPYVSGAAPRFATLDGPRSLEACGADFGYGWYRLRLRRSRAKKANLLIPDGADRLHLYRDGRLRSLLGAGPGASAEPVTFELPGGESSLVVLADNLGRFSEDLYLDRPAGLCGHLLDVKPVRLAKPRETTEPRADPFELAGFVPRCSVEDRSPYPRYTFEVNLPAKAPLVLVLRGDRPRSVVLVNNQPVGIDAGRGVPTSFTLGRPLKKGRNRITLALIDHAEKGGGQDARRWVTLYKVAEVLTGSADWWYARWQLPEASAFGPIPARTASAPAFFRTTFKLRRDGRPLMIELDGVTKGQIYLNDHNIGRYFIATHTGQKVLPQRRYYLPEPWLRADDDNELILFDEHGRPPTKAKLTYDAG